MARSRTNARHLLSRTLGLFCAGALTLGTPLAYASAATTTAPAGAANPEAEALSEQAVAAFDEERYEESIELFEQAYALNSNPNYLFNIGRVYEEKGDLKQAVSHYQRFVAQPGVDLEAREAATARLKVLREALRQLEEDEKEQEEEDDPPEDDGPEPLQDPEPAEPVTTDPAPTDAPPSDRKRGQRIAGYTLLGVGGAGLIVGGILGGLASSKANEADDEEFVDDALRMRDDARRQARAADAMFITGGVFAATGLVLVLTTLRKNKSGSTAAAPRRWVLSPTASPTSAGAAVHGRF